jgi:hypothetical protein
MKPFVLLLAACCAARAFLDDPVVVDFASQLPVLRETFILMLDSSDEH